MTQSVETPPGTLTDERIDALLARFSSVNVVVVGDAFLDEYLRGDARRVSPEAPVPVVHVHEESTALGGAANVVRNVVALGAGCAFCSVVGADPAGDEVAALLEDLGVGTDGLLRVTDRPTTRKTRIVARQQQIVRVDREALDPLAPEDAARVVAAVKAALPSVQTVVLQDYGKGLLSEAVVRPILRAAAALSLPVNLDPKHDLRLFRGVSLVKPNLGEAEAISGMSARGPGGLDAVVRELQKRCDGADVAITDGARGITIFEGEAPGVPVPTVASEVSDVQGAGDTIVATLSIALRAGATLWEAAVLANAAASVVVRKAGTATATRAELRAAVAGIRDAAEAALRSTGATLGSRNTDPLDTGKNTGTGNTRTGNTGRGKTAGSKKERA